MTQVPTKPRLEGIKQGDTFTVYLDYAIDGVPDVFSASQLASHVRDRNGSLLSVLTIVADNGTPGRYIGEALPVDTSKWPVGDVYFDVKRTVGGVVTSTDTVVIPVAKAETR